MSKGYTYYFFLGIGGIGMSALARHLHAQGSKVWGYDKTPSPLTDALASEGIVVSFKDAPSVLPVSINEHKDQILVIYTPAIPQDNELLNFFKEEGVKTIKRAKMLGKLTRDTVNLSVAGTHGKTTTSCMLAAIFKASPLNFSAFLGGISADLNSNYFRQEAPGTHYSISEADEFDRSFLQLRPHMAVITSTDSDHLDIYGNAAEVEASFQEFAQLVQGDVLVASQKTLQGLGITYSATDPTAYYSVRIIEESSRYTHMHILEDGKEWLNDIYVNLPGRHNAENAIAAAVLARKAGVDPDHIRSGLKNFQGIKRRFEYILDREDLVFIDDYAHHPSELQSIIGSVKMLYPGKHITAIFQPHLYSRTRDFSEGFAEVLSQVDELILMPIYPAREVPIEGVSSALILDACQASNKRIMSAEEIVAQLDLKQMEVLLTLGAGDIDRIVQPIKNKYHG